MVAEHYMKEISTWFSTLWLLKNLVAEHYEIDFDMIFRLSAAQNLVAEHYIIEFYMLFHFKAAQTLVAEHYIIEFYMIFTISQLKTWLQSTMKDILT